MRRPALVDLVFLAACGGDGDEPPAGAAAGTNQIERLSTPVKEEADPAAGARLEPLGLADLEREGLLGAGCSFTRGGQILLASVGSDSIVRINGAVRHLIQSATVGPTGGFFEDRQLSVSVGRTTDQGAAHGEATRWPARITITNRRSRSEQRMDGEWTCGA